MTGKQLVVQSIFEVEYDKYMSLFGVLSKASNKDVNDPENSHILEYVYRAYKNKISKNKLNTIKIVKNYDNELAYGFGNQSIWGYQYGSKVVPMTIEVSKGRAVNLMDLTTGQIKQEKI